ncbi:MAG: aspartate aminotransferase family protein, partial [Thermodesulfobacteriota bacterium]
FEAAKSWLPGGETRKASFFEPYPTFMEKGEGCYLYDSDGNKYIDMQNNYTSLVHGHCHPRVNEAAKSQIEKGVVLGSAAEIQYRHAEHLCNRIPCVESVRYNNSGTEATMFAMRLARGFTGKEGILKMDGGYHGMHDYAQVNIFSNPEAEGLPEPWAEPWIPRNLLKDMYIAPFNDLERVEDILKKHKDKIAAVIVEAMQSAGGGILPEPAYLKGMRELTEKYGVLLILDEVMMFRLQYGGLHTLSGIKPDIIALGKLIGGGFPVGAIGGRKDIMEMFSPDNPHPIFHSGTFNANNITLTAGLATMELYNEEAVARLNALGDRLREGFKKALQSLGIKGHVLGMGSILAVHWREEKPENARDCVSASLQAGDLAGLFHLEMLNRGIFLAPRGMFSLTTPMTENEIDTAIETFSETAKLLKPYIADTSPHLLTA